MKRIPRLFSMLMLASPFFIGCSSQEPAHVPTAEEVKQEREADANRQKLAELNKTYFKIPEESVLEDGPNSPLWIELKARYKSDLIKMKQQVESTGAKLVIMMMAVDMSKAYPSGPYGFPFIKSTCAELGLDVLDLTGYLSAQDPMVITQTPRDGHWSKKGAVMIADKIEPFLKKNYDAKSTVVYKDSERPEAFGDLSPSTDEIRDGGKDMPYHVKANAQGVRMDQDITFPKKKKHILFMGDSGIFCPFLNNEFTITGVLQQRFPDALIMNTGIIAYTMEDYVTLWNERAKYSEPDIVVIQTSGGDITDYFFTHRNTLSRSHKPFYPTPNEEAFYKKKYQSTL